MNTISIPTSNLHGQQLDWAVALALGYAPILSPLYAGGEVVAYQVHIGVRDTDFGGFITFEPSENWDQGGPTFEREGISLTWLCDSAEYRANTQSKEFPHSPHIGIWQYGPTALIAAMRCYVASKLGDTVDIPVELL